MLPAEVEELKNVAVPWLNVDDERTRTHSIATLVYITSSGVVGSQHRHGSVAATVSSGNVRCNNLPKHRQGKHEEHDPVARM